MNTTRLTLPRIAILPVLLLLGFAFVTAPPVGAQDSRSNLKNFQHVFVIMMENTGFDTLIGNSNAPFINAAASNYGLATNYFGVTHPSQPNYIAATSGSTNGVADDSDTTIDVANIVDQFEAHGKRGKRICSPIRFAPLPWITPAATSSTNASTILSSPTWMCRAIRRV